MLEHLVKWSNTAASLVLCLLLVNFSSAVLANESSLILPVSTDANVELTHRLEKPSVDPSHLLQVFVGKRSACCTGRSPVAGRYLIKGSQVIFYPAFDFVEGQTYVVLYRENGSTEKFAEFTIQLADENVSPEVVAIYPSGTNIPENTLRFYIQFSTPMKPGVSTDYIKLADASGKVDTATFMSFTQELWSEDRMQLTLLMDPGRVKRGVAQNLRIGPALLKDKKYTLVIEEGWPAAVGAQTTSRYEKPITVTQALRQPPDTTRWKIRLPRVSTRDALIIEFDRPFDFQLAQKAISVLNLDGYLIPGKVVVENDEKTWRFQPEFVWSTQSVQITVDSRLEDVAGNNFKELLDRPVGADVKIANHESFMLDLRPL